MLDRLNSYLELIRFYKPTGTLLLLYPVLISFAFLGVVFTEYKLLGLIMLAGFLMRSSGCIINDLCDINFDKKVKRTKERPLASGKISRLEAVIILVLFLSLALSILLKFEIEVIKFGIFLIIPITIYPLTKRFFKYPQIFLGLTFNLSVFLVWLILLGRIDLNCWLLYTGLIFWTIGYDTIYGHQDIDDDKKIGVKSAAISFGKLNPHLIILSYMIFFMTLLALGLLNGYRILFMLSLNTLAIIILAKLLYLDLASKKQCQYLFQYNNKIGIILFLIFLLT